MSDVVCLTDNFSSDNIFTWACEYLSSVIHAEVVQSPVDLITWVKSAKPKIIISNLPISASLCSNAAVSLYVTYQFLVDQGIRRLLAMKTDALKVFTCSMALSKHLNDQRFQAKVQYPFLPTRPQAIPNRIIFSGDAPVIHAIRSEMIREEFHHYESESDFATAKLYISLDHSLPKLLRAQSYGVPTIGKIHHDIMEFISPGDLLLPDDTNIKQWLSAVRTSMRNHIMNANIVKQNALKYNNLDLLVDKVKKMNGSPVVIAPEKQASPVALLMQQRLSERSARVVAKRQLPRYQDALTAPETFAFQRVAYAVPNAYTLPAPPWFAMNSTPDVSIIVPMFNSSHVIDQQIRNWDMEEDELCKELIYVSDACPQNSAETVMSAWKENKNIRDTSRTVYPNGFTYRVGKVINLSHHSGFATACNAGVQHCSGKYVLFLNADCIVTQNWVKPMWDLLESDSNIGIVGNLQLKQDGTIDSAGSEWMWDSRSFDHIGRNVYKGKRLRKMMYFTEAPDELLEPAEREMVTGCCFMMRKDLFDKVGGFDINYRIGYWEDSDLNMKVRSLGYKVYYQPHSIVYHHTGHSGAAAHPYVYENARHFYDKWVNTGKINALVKPK